MRNSMIQDGASIGANATIVDSIVGPHAVIGSGAPVSGYSVIGDGEPVAADSRLDGVKVPAPASA
ncbi:MAG: hypothetical protein R2706_09675 [Acidimicrobiales bacterium]